MAQPVSDIGSIAETYHYTIREGVSDPAEGGWKATMDAIYELSRAGNGGGLDDDSEDLLEESYESKLPQVYSSIDCP